MNLLTESHSSFRAAQRRTIPFLLRLRGSFPRAYALILDSTCLNGGGYYTIEHRLFLRHQLQSEEASTLQQPAQAPGPSKGAFQPEKSWAVVGLADWVAGSLARWPFGWLSKSNARMLACVLAYCLPDALSNGS